MAKTLFCTSFPFWLSDFAVILHPARTPHYYRNRACSWQAEGKLQNLSVKKGNGVLKNFHLDFLTQIFDILNHANRKWGMSSPPKLCISCDWQVPIPCQLLTVIQGIPIWGGMGGPPPPSRGSPLPPSRPVSPPIPKILSPPPPHEHFCTTLDKYFLRTLRVIPLI